MRKRLSFRNLAILTLGALLLWPAGCAAPRFDVCSTEGRQALIDQTNLFLSAQNCDDAIASIETVYASACTGNDVRLIRASAHACAAQVNFFGLIGSLTSANLVGKFFWRSMAELFPSTTTDTRVESSWYAEDALMSALKSGKIVSSANQINSGTVNVGSTVGSDRIDDANAYLIFLSMATIGGLENRYSAPDASYVKTLPLGYDVSTVTTQLGWAKAVNVDEEGCSYAASVLNLLDAIEEVGPKFSSALSTSLVAFAAQFKTALDAACDEGCQGTASVVIPGSVVSGCALAAGSCTTCPRTLRSRGSCTGLTTDKNSCAAAGIVNFVNSNPLVGWVP